jgi:hypothetical protein
MFSAFTRFPDVGRWHAVPAVAAFVVSNHHQRASQAGHVIHRDRPLLVCRWWPDPTTGKPVCGWEIDGSEAACAAEPGGRVFALVAFCQTRGSAMWAVEPRARSQIWTRDLDVPLQGVRALQREPRRGTRVNLKRR